MLKEGDKAPDFTGIDQDGKAVSLEQFRGKKLILYFYPKDNTTGCTAEACSLRDGYAELKRNGFEIVGVSPDGEKSHRGFADKHGLHADSRYRQIHRFRLRRMGAEEVHGS